MGTRADFYVGRGESAEWLGSIAWDGYPDGISGDVLRATTESEYRGFVSDFLGSDDYATMPEQGWPWPWDDSNTTDYAYAFDGDTVWISGFGCEWFRMAEDEPEESGTQVFPNMRDRQNIRTDKGSGAIFISGGA
jgi:hypothetical protein